MRDELEERYEIQIQTDGDWETRDTFAPDERRYALRQARKMNHIDPYLQVRVTFDSFNHMDKHHTRGVIYRSPKLKRPTLEDERIGGRTRLSFWEYAGSMFNVALMALGGGAMGAVLIHFLMRGLEVALDQQTQEFLTIGTFVLMFFVSAHYAFQYVRQHYIYDPTKKKRKREQRLQEHEEQIRENAPSAISEVVQYEMKTAARDVSHMPVQSHENASQTAYETMDDPASLFKDNGLAAAKTDQDVVAERRLSPQQMMNLLRDHVFHQMTLQRVSSEGENRLGLLLFLMGAAENVIQRYQMTEKQANRLINALFKPMGLSGERLDRFLFDYEIYQEDDVHGGLIAKGAQISALGLQAQQAAVQKMPAFLKSWQAQLASQKEGTERPYIMTVRFSGTETDEGISLSTAWPVGWSAILRPFRSYIFDVLETGDGLMMDFKTVRGVFEASEQIKREMGRYDTEGEGLKTSCSFAICHESEDEIEGDSAVALLETIPTGALVLTQTAYGKIKKKEAYVLTALKLKDDTAYRFDGFVDDGKERENDSKSVTSTDKSLQLQEFD